MMVLHGAAVSLHSPIHAVGKLPSGPQTDRQREWLPGGKHCSWKAEEWQIHQIVRWQFQTEESKLVESDNSHSWPPHFCLLGSGWRCIPPLKYRLNSCRTQERYVHIGVRPQLGGKTSFCWFWCWETSSPRSIFYLFFISSKWQISALKHDKRCACRKDKMVGGRGLDSRDSGVVTASRQFSHRSLTASPNNQLRDEDVSQQRRGVKPGSAVINKWIRQHGCELQPGLSCWQPSSSSSRSCLLQSFRHFSLSPCWSHKKKAITNGYSVSCLYSGGVWQQFFSPHFHTVVAHSRHVNWPDILQEKSFPTNLAHSNMEYKQLLVNVLENKISFSAAHQKAITASTSFLENWNSAHLN